MASYQHSHPLPPPPPNGAQRSYEPHQPPPQTPPQLQHRSKSSFSARSDKSHRSSGSFGKLDLHETAKEKASQRLSPTTKADPSAAMVEAEPSAVATGQKSLLAPLRAIVHLDANGNPIADPDRSNPTRSRWERPLDTIRSFEAAIDGSYSRKPYNRAESTDVGNRRSSYFGGSSSVGMMTPGMMTPRYPQEGWNGNRPNSFRPDSYVDARGVGNGQPRNDGYYDNHARASNSYYPTRARYPRTASEPHYRNGPGVYPVAGNQHSYETVTTASGSGSSGDPAGYTTDPSSENSSVDRVQASAYAEQIGLSNSQQYATPDLQLNNYEVNGQGTNGYGGHPGRPADIHAAYQGQNRGPPPPPPPHKENIQGSFRAPFQNPAPTMDAYHANEAPRPSVGEKRRSWFGLKRKG